MKRIGVLMGGWGEEREISLKTGEAIATALESTGRSVQRILAGPGLDQTLRAAHIDVAFLALHGRMGEDGRVQGLLEVLEIPYTGSGVLASAVAMDKPVAKRLFAHANVPVACGYTTRPCSRQSLERLHSDLGFPCIVKPARGGSTIGLTVVRAPDGLEDAVTRACAFGGEALIERRLIGRELTVGILEDRVLGSCEIAYPSDAFDYDTKYKTGASYFLPPRLSPTRIANVEAIALAAFRSLGCRGYGRVDMISCERENDVVLEVNTLPGMTPMSLLPKIARHAGVPFERLVERILGLAQCDGAGLAQISDTEGDRSFVVKPIRALG